MPRHFRVTGEVHSLPRAARLPATIGHRNFSNIAFHNNYTAIPQSPAERLTIRDVGVYRCQHWACSAYGVAFEDVTINDIRGGGLAMSFLWGCLFQHVVLRGWFGGVQFRWQVDPNDQLVSRRFLTANLTAYTSLDWALDISEASFSTYQGLLGVPAALIRRNPEKHFILNRESALELVSRPDSPALWRITAEGLIASSLADTVVVTGGLGKSLKSQLAEANLLRAQGLLE